MKFENNMTMKMKLNPELRCLEAQEKFWRGRFKEINENFAEERKKMEMLLKQITAENKQLKNDLNELALQSSKYSVSVQTSPMNNETDLVCKYCQRPMVKTRTIFSKRGESSYENLKEDENKSEFFIDNDLILRENAPFTRQNGYCNDEYDKINVERTITKLFSSNDHSDSEKITNKLVELYEKRSKSVPDLVYNETDYENSLQADNKLIEQDDSDRCDRIRNEILKPNDDITSDDSEKIYILDESTHQLTQTPKHSKRSRFLPAVQNIRKKMFKNLSKIRRTCTDIKMTDTHVKSCVKLPNEKDISNPKLQLSLRKTKNEEAVEELQASPKCQLISAMKKSKSTGNIVKKVAFLDDLPSMKTVSESNLLQVDDYRFKRQSDVKPLLVGSVQVHRDKFDRPIPAPRFRKNVIVINS